MASMYSSILSGGISSSAGPAASSLLRAERLAERGDMAIVLVEQYFEFARDLADRFYVLNRGEIVMEGKRGEMDEAVVRYHLTV